MNNKTVLIIGASPKKDRYSYKAMNLLIENGYEVLLYNPVHKEINGLPVINDLIKLNQKIDIITVYVNEKRVSSFVQIFKQINPEKIIFNPGTENEKVINELSNNGIRIVKGCTILLLKTNQFETV